MWKTVILSCLLCLSMAPAARAHFGMVIPDTPMVTDKKESSVTLDVSFSHPMEMKGMPMPAPTAFGVVSKDGKEDLTSRLKPHKVMGQDAWQARYAFKKPGVYQFVMEPTPYWEPAEGKYIVHYTKTYVPAFGEEEGWDAPAGVKTEIIPLTRPFGNYAGAVFQGRVLLDGKPVPNAEVEVEYYNKDKKYVAPNEYMVTQAVRADADGVFTVGIPFAGWWGFAALSMGNEKMDHKGEPADVELGAVLWVHFVTPKLKK